MSTPSDPGRAGPVLSVRGLRVAFSTARGDVEAVRGVDLDVRAGETVAVVGESGSGKSTLASCVNRLLPENGRIIAGSVRLGDLDLTTADERTLRDVRGRRVGMVPQDPMTGLNPVLTVGAQIAEALEVHDRARGSAARAEAVALLERAGLTDAGHRVDQYPHEFSGGMRQRVLIAMALACRPEVLLADEPTSALDVTVQRLVLDQMAELADDLGSAVVLITHDLALAAERADRVAVMYRGEIVETGPAEELVTQPRHEYTRRLLGAAPGLAVRKVRDRPAGASEGAVDPGEESPLLTLSGVVRRYRVPGRSEPLTAVDQVDLEVPVGRTVAVVGESGSGKSTTARLALRLEDPDEGTVHFDGEDVTGRRGRRLRGFRRAVQPVFQNPYASLDPRYTVEQAVAEPLVVHRVGDARTRRVAVRELLDRVALPVALAERRPHELSGGQRQRVAIARALALDPRLVVMDEAVSALDVLVQEQVLDLMVRLQEELGLSYLFITHDLAVVRLVAHRVYVMKDGRIVEHGDPEALFADPREDYTRRLLDAIPGRSLARS
ncbi:ABC transporter ATP-binding protein [Phycicoccus sp. DTK01]|uniref:dipeptide ABC transporter ATP-binding protein n=1 Tax=Phycicoccus sp. DTK01 TaxID=2785745 RepID=UPI001A8D46A0|nr:ABC transporter ATP-binding protein [Phycicoccus sp. DTK01]GIL36435.1 ABC transporter ATP-binding protein [Phycicoccus sp. DTK01]